MDEGEFEPWEFDDTWLREIEFFVRFNDQQGRRHENRRVEQPTPSWTSVELSESAA